MAASVPPRDGYRTLTPYLGVEDAAAAHRFYAAAFGAEMVAVLEGPGDRIAHGALRIGDSIVVVIDELPQLGLMSPRHGGMCSVLISCDDADALFERAVGAGARPVVPVSDTFSGDRHGLVVCPFGHRWIISSRVEEVSDAEVLARWQALLAGQSQSMD